jgi:GMP synthase-like glutamine amidotransferase
MRVHCIEHVWFEGPGRIAEWACARGLAVTRTQLHSGDALPSPDAFDWLVIMGGPMSVNDERRYAWLAPEKRLIRQAQDRGCTVLGVCLGAQLIADALGARVYRAGEREIGWWPVQRVAGAEDTSILRGLPPVFDAFHWHAETFDLPEGAVHLASSAACRNQAFAYGPRVLGLQFHIEVTERSLCLLLDNSTSDLRTPGRYVQTASETFPNRARLENANRAMDAVLAELERNTIQSKERT